MSAANAGGVLVISMDAASDAAVLQYDGTNYTVTDGTGASKGTFATAAITNGITVDGDADPGQSFLFKSGSTALPQALTVGNTVELATIDAGILNAASVTLSAAAITLNANITTTGAQAYAGAITLAANTTLAGTTVTNSSTIAGGGRSLAISGDAVVNGAISGVTDFSVSGETSLGANVTTTGSQAYTGLVTLTGNAALQGTSPTFTAGIKGESKNLTLAFSNGVTLSGTTFITNVNDLTSAKTSLSGTITTAGAQSYTGAVTLADNTTLVGTTVTNSSTITGGTKSLTITGDAVVNGPISGVTDFSVSGETSLGANVTTTGSQAYAGLVTLTGNATLRGTTPTFSAGIGGAGYNLTLDFSGTTTIDGAQVTNVRNLATGNGGLTQLTGTISTLGTQTYGDNVTLIGNTTLLSGVNAILFSGTVDSSTDGAYSLDITNTATTTFTFAVGGGGKRLASLTGSPGGTIAVNGGAVTTSGDQTYAGVLSLGANTVLTGATGTFFTINGNNRSLTLTFTNQVSLAGVTINNVSSLIVNSPVALQGTITAAGNVTFGAVTLLGDTTINAGAFSVTFLSTVDSNPSGSFELTVNSTATTAFNGQVGATGQLANLTTDAGGITTIDSGNINTTGAQSFGDTRVTLLSDTTFSGMSQTFANTLDANNNDITLAITSATGVSVLDGSNVLNLATLTTSGTGTIKLKNILASTGAQAYGTKVLLDGDTTLDTTVNGDVAAITFSGLVDGGKALELVALGQTTFGSAVGSSIPLLSLTTSALGPAAVNGGYVETSGKQAYQAGVTFGATTVLKASEITFADNANAGSRSLTATASTGAITANAVGSAITAGTLTLTAATGIDVNTAVTTLDASVTGAGDIVVIETDDITLGAVTGVSTTAGDVSVTADNGKIQINKAVSASGASVTLIANDGITAASGITAVTADGLDITNLSSNQINLPRISVANLGVTQDAAAAVTITNLGNLGIGVGSNGITTKGTATITATGGAITLNQPSLVDGAAITLTLSASAGITQLATGTVGGAGTLNAVTTTGTAGAVVLDAGGNSIAKVQGATKAGGFTYVSGAAVQVLAIGTQGGAITVSGPTGANITLAGALTAGTGTVSISTATAAGNISSAGGSITTSSATGDITLSTDGGGTIDTPTITATGGDVTVRTLAGGAITVANALSAGGGNVLVETVAGGNIQSSGVTVRTSGAGTITLQTGTSASITTGVLNSGSGAITLSTAGSGAAIDTTAGAITTSGGAVNASTGAGGDITLANVTTAGGNQTYTTGSGGDFNSTSGTLTSGGGTITATAAGAGSITVAKISSNGGAIRLDARSTSATAVLLTNDVSASTTGRITLASGGGISDNGAANVTASQLVVESANGAVTLNQTGNDFGALALLNASGAANKIVSGARSLTIGVAGVATPGIQTASGAVSIDNSGFTLGATSTALISIGTAILTLEADVISLGSTAHEVTKLAATAGATGGITFKAAGDLAIVTGSKATDGSDVDGLSALAGGARITLTAAGAVTQDAVANPNAIILAGDGTLTGKLTISASGVSLGNVNNNVAQLQVNSDGSILYVDADDVAIGINGLAGAPNKAGGTSIASGGDLSQFAPVYASTLTASASGSVTLLNTSNDVDLFAASSGTSSALIPVGIAFADANDVTLGNVLADDTPGNAGYVFITVGGSITVTGELGYDTATPGSLVLQHGTGGTTTYVVSSTGDLVIDGVLPSGAAALTLRQRINYLNDNAVISPQDERITFVINQFFPIAITNQLPTIERKVTIGPSGVTDPDYRIAIDGSYTTTNAIVADGLTFGFGNAQGLGSNNSVIQGLTIYGFNGNGIVLHSSGNTVTNCWIGITRGSEVKANAGVGIDIESTVGPGTTKLASSNAITDNVVSGNTGAGIRLQNQATLTTITNNKIGTNSFGTVPIGNGGYGIEIVASNLTTVGGVDAANGNTIANNTKGGISISGALASGSTNLVTKIFNNTISNNSGAGVAIDTALGNIVGSSGAANTISDNSGAGVSITNARATSLAAGNLVQANTISLNRQGGVVLENTAFQTISGGNVITSNGVFATNTGAGVEIRSSATDTATDNIVAGNFIGTDTNADTDGGNAGQGILLTGAINTLIGSAATSDANVIAYNRTSGIQVEDDVANSWTATANRIRGNTIRLNGVLGDTGLAGVRIDGGSKNIVGGINAGEGNTISDNKQAGVLIVGAANTSFDAGNRVAGNTINANELDGVALSGSTFQSIDAANVITANGRDGVSLAAASNNNRILGNRIGIDATGLSAGNERDGIRIDDSTGSAIGDAAAANRNVIAANGTGSGGGSGILLTNKANATTIRNNVIGLDAAGLIAGNVGRGISVVGTGANPITGLVVGGTGTNEGNVISGNGLAGVRLEETSNALVRGNRIGTDAAGGLAIGNLGHGVEIVGGTATDVGGTVATAANVISGNSLSGVSVTGGGTGHLIRGNRIGTNAAGTAAIANLQHGIAVDGAATTVTIGGTALNTPNTISGNSIDGINIANGTATVLGNFIGTNSASSAALANGGDGIQVAGGTGTAVGDGTAQGRNVISGNAGRGLYLTGGTQAAVTGNYVGTNVAGTAALANALAGVRIEGATKAAIGTVNVISGNAGAGIELVGAATTAASITGNFIGTNAAGTAAIANGGAGVSLLTAGTAGVANQNVIGGLSAGNGNVIAGNTSHGISVTNSTNALVAQNSIGLTASGATLGNGGSGLAITNSTAITATYKNQIAANTAYGVLVSGGSGNFIGADAAQTNKGLAYGNAITRNKLDGIRIEGGATTTIVAANTVGTLGQGNAGRGITIDASNGNTIGGATAGGVAYGNLVVGNTLDGVGILNSVAASLAAGNKLLGNQVRSNLGRGVVVDNSDFQSVGGTGTGEGNTLVLNVSHGIELRNDADANKIVGNFIGTNSSYAGGLGNSGAGVRIAGGLSQSNALEGNRIQANAVGGVVLDGAVGNTVGGNGPGLANTIVLNKVAGVALIGKASLNTVSGNYIGTDAAGASLGNLGDGVSVQGSVGNTIGGTNAGDGNTIRANQVGVSLVNAVAANLGAGNLVAGNIVDANLREGIRLFASSFNTVGGDDATSAPANTVTRNAGDGIAVVLGSASNLVQNNTVGGSAANANSGAGIRVVGSTRTTLRANAVGNNLTSGIIVSGSGLTAIGGGTSADGNSITANKGDGILLTDAAMQTTIRSNTVSANTGNGISVQRSTGNIVGTAGAGNTLVSNALDGVLVAGVSASTVIQANEIGGAIAANGGNGIRVAGAFGTLIGGTGAGEGNTINANTRAGVAIEAVASRTADAATRVFGNTIGNTSGAGIAVTGSTNQIIGGTAAGQANEFAFNAVGVQIAGGSTGILVTGNTIEDSATHGVSIVGSTGNTVSGNTITGSAGDGIRVSQAVAKTLAAGNRIVSNSLFVNGGAGVRLAGGTSFTTVGAAGQANTIGSNAVGVAIEGASTNNVVANNLIGTDGVAKIGNTGAGIDVSGSLTNVLRANTVANNATGIRIANALATTAAAGNQVLGNAISDSTSHGIQIVGGGRHTIGGTAAGSANTITKNGGSGIAIAAGTNGVGSVGNVIRGNYVGIDAAGTAGLGNTGSGISITGGSLNEISSGNVVRGNGGDGISLSASSLNTIGGAAATAANTISGNTGNGVSLAAGSASNVIAANTISGNTKAGVAIAGSTSQNNVVGMRVIGGAASGLGNTISNNTGAGVVVDAASRNQIFANLMSGNSTGGNAGGIVLQNGGNGSAVAPTLASVSFARKALTLTGSIAGAARGSSYWLDVFGNGTVAGTAQANQPLGRVLVKVGVGGAFTATLTLPTGTFVSSGTQITATATDLFGNTSSISTPRAVA